MEALIPGGPYVNVDATRQALIPGGPYINAEAEGAGASGHPTTKRLGGVPFATLNRGVW